MHEDCVLTMKTIILSFYKFIIVCLKKIYCFDQNCRCFPFINLLPLGILSAGAISWSSNHHHTKEGFSLFVSFVSLLTKNR